MKIALIIILTMFLYGCSFAGSSTSLEVTPTSGWFKPDQPREKFIGIVIGSWHQDWLAYKCDDFYIVISSMKVSSSDLVGLAIIPIIPGSWLSEGEGNPDIDIFLVQNKSADKLPAPSVYLALSDENKELEPVNIDMRDEPSKAFKIHRYKLEFDVPKNKLDNLSLVFKEKIGSCSVPPAKLEAKKSIYYVPYLAVTGTRHRTANGRLIDAMLVTDE